MRNLMQVVIIALTLIITPLQAQVTIGSQYAPNKGALLDLKENTDGTSLRGLGLPKVRLKSVNSITDNSISGVTPANANEHIGLLVYNTRECHIDDLYVGLYVWDGVEWSYLGQKPQDAGLTNGVYEFTDTRDNEVYLVGNFGDAGNWMLENMRYIDPSFSISQSSDDRTSRTYFYPQREGFTETNPANIPTWDKRQGILYSYAAATMGAYDGDVVPRGQVAGSTPAGYEVELDFAHTNKEDSRGYRVVQGMCPDGWHLPSDREWNDLERELYTSPEKYSTYTSSNEFNPTLWNPAWETTFNFRGSSNDNGHGAVFVSQCNLPASFWGTKGRSKSSKSGGFDALLIGRGDVGIVKYYGFTSSFWSSSPSGGNGWTRVTNDIATISRDYVVRTTLTAVRCKKD